MIITAERANTCEILQNELRLNDGQLSEYKLVSDDFSDKTHVP